MSGTYGYDGYIYQANVSLYLILQKLKNQEGLSKFILELRKPNQADARKDDFTIDLIILYSNEDTEPKCDAVEIKGGKESELDLLDIKTNLDAGVDSFVQIQQHIIITKKLIVRSLQEPLSYEDLVIEPLDDEITEEMTEFSGLEKKCIEVIEEFMKEFIPSRELHYYSRIIFYSLRHFVEFKIKQLAWKLRLEENHNDLESAEVIISQLFDHAESFTDAFMNSRSGSVERTVLRDRLVVYSKVKGSSVPPPELSSPTDSGINI